MTPTQRSLAILRELGYTVQKVEQWNSFAKIRIDLFGFGDILAIREGSKPLIVQTCSATDGARRRDKILANSTARLWLQVGGEMALHRWAKRGDRGKRKYWDWGCEYITEDQFTFLNKETIA